MNVISDPAAFIRENSFWILAVFAVLLLLSVVVNRREQKREESVPGYILDFIPDGNTPSGEPFLLCPVCSQPVLVPTISRELAIKKVKEHIKVKHIKAEDIKNPPAKKKWLPIRLFEGVL